MKDAFFVNKKRASPSSRIGNPRKLANPTARRSNASFSKETGAQSRKRRLNDIDGKGARQNDSGEESDVGGIGNVDEMDLVGDRDRHLKQHGDSDDEAENDEGHESAAQKRLKLAKRYLDKIKGDGEEEMAPTEFDAQDIDNDLIAERLREDVLESKKKVYHKIAHRLAGLDMSAEGRVRSFGGKKVHQLSLTCLDVVDEEGVVGAGGVFIYTGSKDGHIVKWDFTTGRKVHEFLGGRKPTKKAIKAFGETKLKKHIGHKDQVLCLAISHDGKYLASGGRDKTVQIWSIPNNKHISSFTQHRDAVSGVSFRYTSRVNQLYSCSHDRTIKLWNIDELSYIETLFGHQDKVESIDSLAFERCVSVGARDRTARLWKIVEESQLIFRGGGGGIGELGTQVIEGVLLASEVEQAKKDAKRAGNDNFGCCIDVIAMLDEEHFITGTDNGSISLWNIGRKKPVFTRVQTHGKPGSVPSTTIDAAPCHWITALAVVRYADLFASGSCDGYVRFWQVAGDKKSFSEICAVPVEGFINALRFFEAPVLTTAGALFKPDQAEVYLHGRSAAKKRELVRKEAESAKPNTILHLAVATGQEHRLGRWWRSKNGRNQLKVIILG